VPVDTPDESFMKKLEQYFVAQNPDSQTQSFVLAGFNELVSPSIDDNTVRITPEQLAELRQKNIATEAVEDPAIASIENLTPVMNAPSQDTGMLSRKRIERNTLIMVSAFVGSKILGLLRTSLFAYMFGTGHVSDAYTQAFLIPDTLYSIVAGGALSSVFIPIFLDKHDAESRWQLVSTTLNLLVVLLVVLAGLGMIFARQLVPLYNPGATTSQLDLIAFLTRIMLLQSILLGVGVIFTSILNASNKFLFYALSTILYNVGQILGLLVGYAFAIHGKNDHISAAYFASWGVVFGAILQLAILIPPTRALGMRYSRSFNWRLPEIRDMTIKITPRVFNSGVLYFSTFVDRFLLSSLSLLLITASLAGLITQYSQAFQLIGFPLTIIGSAVGTAAFPTLAEYVTSKKFERVQGIVMDILRFILYISVPCMIGLMVLGVPLIQVLLQHGAYTLQDSQSTAIPLALFALGLPAFASVEILTRAFYALQDTKRPVVVSILQFLVKILLSFGLIRIALLWGPGWGMGGLAFSTSLTTSLEAMALLYMLQRRMGGLHIRSLLWFLLDTILAALCMGLLIYFVHIILDILLVTTNPGQTLGTIGTLLAFIKLLIEVSCGSLCYIRCTRFLKIQDAQIQALLTRFHLGWV
jgi:putative peptidoglycan lipid II flippase